MSQSILPRRLVAPDDLDNRRLRLRFEGAPLGELNWKLESTGALVEKYAEANGLSVLLVAVGIEEANMIKQEPPAPDFCVELAHARTVNVEYANVRDESEARPSGIVRQLNVGIHRKLERDAALTTKYLGSALSFVLHSVPAQKQDLRALVAEALKFARDVDLKTLNFGHNKIPSDSVELSKYAVQIDWFDGDEILHFVLPNHPKQAWRKEKMPVGRRFQSAPQYQPGTANVKFVQLGNNLVPPDLAAAAKAIVKNKARKGYKASPLWLALLLLERGFPSEPPFEVLARTPLEISPFQRVIMGNNEQALVYDAPSAL